MEYRKALAYAAKGDPSAAAASLRACLRDEPGRPEAVDLLARLGGKQ